MLLKVASSLAASELHHPESSIFALLYDLTSMATEFVDVTEASLTTTRARELDPCVRTVFVEPVYKFVKAHLTEEPRGVMPV